MADIHPNTPPLLRAIAEGRIPKNVGVAMAIAHQIAPVAGQPDSVPTPPQMTEAEVEAFINELSETGIVLEQ